MGKACLCDRRTEEELCLPPLPLHNLAIAMELVGTGDLVAVWEIHLSDGVHSVEFEHGTTSGKRVVRIDGKEVLRHDWMFKLVGTETFKVGKSNATCVIKIDPVGGFASQYSLMVNGK